MDSFRKRQAELAATPSDDRPMVLSAAGAELLTLQHGPAQQLRAQQAEIDRLTAELAAEREANKTLAAVIDDRQRLYEEEIAKAQSTGGQFIKHWHEACNKRDRLTAELAELTAICAAQQTDMANAREQRDEARRELAEAKEKHERELFDCGGTNDAWAMEVDKLKAELTEAKRERDAHQKGSERWMVEYSKACNERDAARAEVERLKGNP